MKKLYSLVLMLGPHRVATTAAELVGASCITVGAAMVYAPAGWLIGGGFVLAAGVIGGLS